MRADTLKIVIGEAAYYVDDPRPGDGVKATVSVVMEGEPLARPLHRDRLNLDSAKARDKFAKEAGTDPDDLNEVRDRVLDFLAPAAPSSAETSDETDPEVSKAAMALLDAPNVLDQVRTAIAALGYAGDRTQPLLVFLVLLSRLLARPINLVVGGPSAAGKSFLVMLVARLFPSVATYSLNGMSERVLVYTDADLRHRTLIVAEAAALHRDGIGAALLRSIAWEGSVVYETVEKTPDGLQPRRIEKEGPTGFVTTTTKSVEAELETRVLTIHVPDDPKATRTILLATAERANGRLPDAPDLRPWHELQRWLVEEGTHEVTIPYADRLGAAYPAEKVRSRRDFTQLLGLIQACALLHQRQRESDAAGRVIATEADYRVVYDLTHPVFGAIAAEGVTPAVRAAVQKVAEMIKDMDGGRSPSTNCRPRLIATSPRSAAMCAPHWRAASSSTTRPARASRPACAWAIRCRRSGRRCRIQAMCLTPPLQHCNTRRIPPKARTTAPKTRLQSPMQRSCNSATVSRGTVALLQRCCRAQCNSRFRMTTRKTRRWVGSVAVLQWGMKRNFRETERATAIRGTTGPATSGRNDRAKRAKRRHEHDTQG